MVGAGLEKGMLRCGFELSGEVAMWRAGWSRRERSYLGDLHKGECGLIGGPSGALNVKYLG